MRGHVIGSVSDFVSFIENHCHRELVLFRGQPIDEPLVPRIARIELKHDPLKAEWKMFSEFKRLARPFLAREYHNDWDWLALAQHHEMATRLLDWTTNPLAALWFAIREPPSNDRSGVVWVFCPPEKDVITPEEVGSGAGSPFAARRTKVFRPNQITQRIVAQGGWFTVHKYLDKHKAFVPLDRNKLYKDLLTKLTIPARAFADMRYHLDRLGINQSSMFPGLDGICGYVQWLHSLMHDEAPGKRAVKSTAMASSRNGNAGSRAVPSVSCVPSPPR